ncbi:hypothetical protein FVR03_08165 [Pontibacter qinzhouensis]|uniref:Helicase-associated domain-containing protein n=1 Tax=Pontibacter qinzhouensis TaxID=2603253 RepID=A0A5C8K795_9BACT|nr:helicase associated domain-containing protein [Pontibacter qinzhouensis]TXK48138.1 hypothetical protein FVR03_08165 [Pontibacter qinzhouensis]
MENVQANLFSKDFLERWHRSYAKLEAHVRQEELVFDGIDEELELWVNIQRQIRHMLPPVLKEKLGTLNFDFKAIQNTWENRYRQLCSFYKKYGHTYLPPDKEHEDLKDWLVRQVIHKKYLTANQLQKLNNVGVDWETSLTREQRWDQMYRRLQDFFLTFGHSRVPQSWEKDKQLSHWVKIQRRKYAHGKLNEDREQKLRELHFIWSIQDVYEWQWESYYQQLVAFCSRFGHCNVPGTHKKLVSWIERQRISKKKNLLAPERESKLTELGFIWGFEDAKIESWEKSYRQLLAFKREHGHCFVPVTYKESKALGNWVATQRFLEARGELQEARRRKLEEVNFVWSRNTKKELTSIADKNWLVNLSKLIAYQEVHGTYQVSININPALQRWISWQRKMFFMGKLSDSRIDKLNAIGFSWNGPDGYWEKMYEALSDYKAKFGHTRVPFQWAPNPKLAAWVYRLKANKSEVEPQKVELLNQLCFDWSLSRRTFVTWEAMYNRLVAYKQEHGNTRVPAEYQNDLKLGKWVSRMRQEKEVLALERINLLDKIGFDWSCRPYSKIMKS